MREYIAFDIETIPGDFDSLSESQQEYLLRGTTTDEEKEQKKREMALTALTGRVVCIGMAKYSLDKTDNGYQAIAGNKIALCVEPPSFVDTADASDKVDGESKKIPLPDGAICLLGNEYWVLDTFWRKLGENPHHTLISFNGRNFDAPFLMHRSAIYKLRPSRNLMEGTRFNYSKHIDLLDELTYYSPSSSGPTRRFNFDFYAQSFGITSPKAQGVDGSKVAGLFDEGKIIDIAEYCLRDVVATWELFEFWNEYLNFKQ